MQLGSSVTSARRLVNTCRFISIDFFHNFLSFSHTHTCLSSGVAFAELWMKRNFLPNGIVPWTRMMPNVHDARLRKKNTKLQIHPSRLRMPELESIYECGFDAWKATKVMKHVSRPWLEAKSDHPRPTVRNPTSGFGAVIHRVGNGERCWGWWTPSHWFLHARMESGIVFKIRGMRRWHLVPLRRRICQRLDVLRGWCKTNKEGRACWWLVWKKLNQSMVKI